jgi:hypothetical protein
MTNQQFQFRTADYCVSDQQGDEYSKYTHGKGLAVGRYPNIFSSQIYMRMTPRFIFGTQKGDHKFISLRIADHLYLGRARAPLAYTLEELLLALAVVRLDRTVEYSPLALALGISRLVSRCSLSLSSSIMSAMIGNR